MTALFRQSLPLDVGADALFFWSILAGPSAQALLDLAQGAATATLTVRVTPSDPAPLLTVSTTSSSSGALTLGVALPAPAGASALNDAELQAVLAEGTPVLVTTPPQPVSDTVATIAALEAISTTSLAEGTIAFVSGSAGGFFAYSPGSTLTPNGTTIVRATDAGGCWLFAVTIAIQITAAATVLLANTSHAEFDLDIVWTGGTTSKLVSGPVPIDQGTTQ